MTVTDLDLDQLLDALAARARERPAPPLVNLAGETVDGRATTGRIQVAGGDTILATWGNTTYDQSCQCYASAADRDTQWPAPHDGSICYTVAESTLWLYSAGWKPAAGSGQPPVTSGGLVSRTDANGTVWVAKPGVNGGAWKNARDVLNGRWYRNTSFPVPSGASGNVTYDVMTRDPYGLWVPGSSAFVIPVPGVYDVRCQVGGAATATGQWVQSVLYVNGVLGAAWNGHASLSTTVYALAMLTTLFAAGDTLQPKTQGSAALNGSVGSAITWGDIRYVGTG